MLTLTIQIKQLKFGGVVPVLFPLKYFRLINGTLKTKNRTFHIAGKVKNRYIWIAIARAEFI